MGQVKGSLLLETARMLRAHKDRDWKKYLSDQDLAVINSRIMPSTWYPLDLYERATYAIFQEIAQGKLEVAWAWGKFVGEDLIKRFYPNLVSLDDMMIALDRFKLIRQQWFKLKDPNLNPIEIQKVEKHQAKIILRVDHPTNFEPYTYQTAGTFERMIEMCRKTDVKVIVGSHDWASNHPFAELLTTWKD
jgi:hypothetical protein